MNMDNARKLRKSMTQWEVRLWVRLRRKQMGVEFRRQHPIGKYIADFACRPLKLVIEVDGEHHNWFGNDKLRDEWLSSQGWRVIRASNAEVQYDLNEVCHMIYNVVRELVDKIPPSSLLRNDTSP